jgi:hypothetical protein
LNDANGLLANRTRRTILQFGKGQGGVCAKALVILNLLVENKTSNFEKKYDHEFANKASKAKNDAWMDTEWTPESNSAEQYKPLAAKLKKTGLQKPRRVKNKPIAWKWNER